MGHSSPILDDDHLGDDDATEDAAQRQAAHLLRRGIYAG
jgi:hypothetical protein